MNWLTNTNKKDVSKSKRKAINLFSELSNTYHNLKTKWPKNNEFYNLCNNLPEPVFVLSDFVGSSILYYNKAWVKLFGYNTKLIATSPMSIIHPDHRDIVIKNQRKRLDGNFDNIEYQIKLILPDKTHIWANIHSSVIKFKGKNRILIIAKDISKEKMKREELINTENTFRSLFSDSQIINLILDDEDGWILDANKSAQTFFKYKIEELVDRSIFDLMPSNNISFDEIKKSNGIQTIKHQLKNGQIRDTEVNISLVKLKTKRVLLYSVRDITVQKSIERALVESEAKYKAIVDNNYDGIYIYRDNNILFANKRIFELSGYSPEIFAQASFWDIIHPEDRPRIMSYAKARAEGRSALSSYNGRVICRGGEIKECEFSVTTIKYFDEFAVLGVVRDISNRIRSEKKLIASNQKYKQLTFNSPVGIFTTDKSGICNFANPKWLKLLNKTEDEVINFHWTQAIYNVSRPAIKAQWLHSNKTNSTFYCEYKIHNSKKEKVRWVYGTIVQLKDKNNDVQGYIGTKIDITDKKVSAEKLKENERFLSTLVGNLNGMVYRCVSDEHWSMLYVSDGIQKLTGYTKDDIIINKKITYNDIIHPEDREKVNESIEWKTKINNHFTLEYRIICKNGELKHVWEQGVCVESAEGDNYLEGIISDISEQKAAEEKLIKSEEKFRYITENSIDIVWQVNNKLLIKYLSPSVKKILGYSPEECIGKRVSQYMEWPDFVQLAKQALQTIHSPIANPILKIETFFIHKNNSKIPLYIEGKVFYDNHKNVIGLHGTARDVSERNKLDQALRENVALYKAIFGNTGTATCIIDPEGIIVLGNRKFEELCRCNSGQIKGEKSLHNFIPNFIISDYTENESKQAQQKEVIFRDKYNKEKSVIINVQMIKESNNYVVSLLDISKRKEVEYQLQKLNEELESRVQLRTNQLSIANNSKSEFLANMSHEIRTPLNAILGFAELLSKKITNPIKMKYLQSILMSGKNLLSLINDTLDLSKIEAGKLDLFYAPANIKSVFNQIEQLFKLKVNEKGLIFKLKIENNLPDKNCTFELDENRLKQVLINLVNNAIKFTLIGSIHIRVIIDLFKDNANNHNNYAQIKMKIQDTGIGISEEFKKKIFDPFTQESNSYHNNYGGTGLGLSISLKLIQLMNGTIDVESEVGKGSTFTITLKKVQISNLEKDNLKPESSRTYYDNILFEKSTILVVDDITLNREYLINVLNEYNFDIFEAKNGNEALEIIKTNHIDLIITDLKMPIKDGFGLQKELRNSEKYKDIPIIASTALANKKSIAKIKNHHFSSYILKPYAINDIIEQLIKFIPHKQKKINTSKKTPNKDFPDVLSNDVKDQITNNVIPIWKKIEKRQSHSEVVLFAKEINNIGRKNKVAYLVNLGEQLIVSMDNFDVVQVINLLNLFKKLVDKHQLQKVS